MEQITTVILTLEQCKKFLKNKFFYNYLKEKVCLLHCVSEHLARVNDQNLQVLKSIKDEFGLTVGLSDHTVGTESS